MRLTRHDPGSEGPGIGAFAFSGIITLLSDFGTRDPFVGLVKAQIYARLPSARIVDLTHELPPYRPAVAGFWLERAARWCPSGTVHVAVVDPGVGTRRRLLAAEAGQQVFLAPDNGLLGSVLAARTPAAVHAIDAALVARFGLGVPSATFHGRDILAPLAAELAAGRAAVQDLGPPVREWEAGERSDPQLTGAGATGRVVLLDRYGNAFTNLDGALLGRFRVPVLHAAGRELPVVRTYGDVPPGTAVALVNSLDVLEVAVAAGDAGRTLGIAPGDPVLLAEGALPKAE